MADTLILHNGAVSTLDLNSTAVPGIRLESFNLPGVVRQFQRTSGFPTTAGSRTVASAFDDTVIDLVLQVRGTTVDSVHSTYLTLVRRLEMIDRWELGRSVNAQYLEYKPDGATNTAYMLVRGVTVHEPSGDPRQAAINMQNKLLLVHVTLLVEPVPHAGALTTVVNAASLTNRPADNDATATTLAGDIGGPLTFLLQNTSGATWSEVWLAHSSTAVQVSNLSGTADATASGSAFQTYAGSGTVDTVNFSTTTTSPLPIRAIVRVKVISGTLSLVRLRFQLRVGGFIQYGPWKSLAALGSAWQLIDLETLRLPSQILNRIGLSADAAPFLVAVQVKNTDGSAFNVGIDYLEVIQYTSFVRLIGSVPDDYHAHYDMTGESGTFIYPLRTPQTYVTNATDDFPASTQEGEMDAYGVMIPPIPNTSPIFWFAAQTTAGHVIAHTGTLTVKHLPAYALALRGSA